MERSDEKYSERNVDRTISFVFVKQKDSSPQKIENAMKSRKNSFEARNVGTILNKSLKRQGFKANSSKQKFTCDSCHQYTSIRKADLSRHINLVHNKRKDYHSVQNSNHTSQSLD